MALGTGGVGGRDGRGGISQGCEAGKKRVVAVVDAAGETRRFIAAGERRGTVLRCGAAGGARGMADRGRGAVLGLGGDGLGALEGPGGAVAESGDLAAGGHVRALELGVELMARRVGRGFALLAPVLVDDFFVVFDPFPAAGGAGAGELAVWVVDFGLGGDAGGEFGQLFFGFVFFARVVDVAGEDFDVGPETLELL